jgi:hypothetical protein
MFPVALDVLVIAKGTLEDVTVGYQHEYALDSLEFLIFCF